MENNKWIDLSGKNVIVTGGSSGIGEQIVKDLLGCGANVVVFDRNAPLTVVKDINYRFIETNITDVESIRKSVTQAKGHLKTIDALVNNAGVTRPRILIDYFGEEPKYEVSEEDYYFMSDVNIKGTLFVSQEVVRIMTEQKYGVIINMSSAAGINGSQGHSVYAATKAAINSFTLSWAKELSKYNIRVNSIAPDVLERTPSNNDEKYRAQAYGRGMDINTPAEEFFKGYKKSIPLGRPGFLYEVSNLVNYLISEHSSYITGVIIPVAGGKTRV